MSTMTLTKEQLDAAIKAIENYLKSKYGEDVVIERDKPYQGSNPLFMPEWAYTGDVRPAILWEGGPWEWDGLTYDDAGTALRDELNEIGIWLGSYSSWAVCLYSTEMFR